MSGKLFARVTALLLTLVLAACGGDSGSSSLSGVGGSGTGEPGDTTETASVGTIQLINESPQIATDGSDSSSITAIIKDTDGRVMPDINVGFAADNDGTVLVQTAVTGANGQASAQVSAGNDPRNRTITVTVTAGDVSRTTSISATGTSISITGPSSIVAGASATYTARLVDADNDPNRRGNH